MLDAGALRGVVIITGHYGVGKTNFALNLCVDAARAGTQVTCADLDIVNPYFRSSDYREDVAREGVEVLAPLFAGTSLDAPGISGALMAAIEAARADENRLLVIDVGGDDAGATALGRFAPAIRAGAYELIYVVNAYRNLTQTAPAAVEALRAIEAACGLRATGIVNNSHLKAETTAATITAATAFGTEVARLTNLPLLAQTVPNTQELLSCADALTPQHREVLYPVKVYVTTPWERGSRARAHA